MTYAASEKVALLGIDPKVIDEFGVVSKEVAKEMAEYGRKLLNVDVCVSVTGNAGPTVEKGDKQVGEAYIGICFKGVTALEVTISYFSLFILLNIS